MYVNVEVKYKGSDCFIPYKTLIEVFEIDGAKSIKYPSGNIHSYNEWIENIPQGYPVVGNYGPFPLGLNSPKEDLWVNTGSEIKISLSE